MAAHVANCVAEELNSGLQKTLRNDSWTRPPNFMFHSKAHILKAKDCNVLTGNCRLQTADFKIQTADCIFHTAYCRLQTRECRLDSVDFRMQTGECRLQSADIE